MKIMKNKMITSVQQGDVLMRKLTEMPEGTITKITMKKMILAHGESGHSHVVEDDESELIEIGNRMLLNLAAPATVVHEEHGPVTLDAGIWEIGRVQEYDYFQKMQRAVMD